MLGGDERDALGLGALRALGRLELDPCALGERLVTLAYDRAVMDEEVLAAFVRGDEPVPLVGVEPLHGSGCHEKTPPPLLRNGQRRRSARIRYSLSNGPRVPALRGPVAALRAEDGEASSRERARREREGDAGERSGARARDEQQPGREREIDRDVPADAEREQDAGRRADARDRAARRDRDDAGGGAQTEDAERSRR